MILLLILAPRLLPVLHLLMLPSFFVSRVFDSLTLPPPESYDGVDDSGFPDCLSDEVKVSLEALKYLETQQIRLDNQYDRERLELDKKYSRLEKPLFERRHALVTGSQPTKEELLEGGELLQQEFPDFHPPTDAMNTRGKGIPNFWLTALQHSEDFADIISSRDAEALQHLADIRYSYTAPPSDPNPGFQLSFYFRPNEFFQNNVLEKEYIFKRGTVNTDNFVYDHATGTDINWRDSMDLTKESETGDSVESFFDFFNPPLPPDPEIDEEEREEVDNKLEDDLQAGETIKDDVIPNALELFLYPLEDDDDSDSDDDDDHSEDDDE